MSRQARLSAAAVALALGMAVMLAACGSDTAATTANITFQSDPPAEVWIAGESKGTTPMDIVLDAGTHEVMFKAAGFLDASEKIAVVGGKNLTLNAELCANAEDEVTLVQLAKALGLEHAPYEEGKVHRGARSRSVTLLWPQRDIRKEGLTSYRIDVSDEYEGDGFIEFRKGRTVLHREAFEPEAFTTVRSMPESVKEAVKTSSAVTWGVYFDSRRKKAITAKFKVVKKAKVDKQLAKLSKRSFFRRQPPLIQDLMRVDVLRNNRLYSEALVGALGILQAHPQSLQPYRGIVEAAQRLGLKDTQLFAEAMQHVSGAGRRGRTGKPDFSGGSGRVGGQTKDLPPVFSSPRREPETAQPGSARPGSSGVTVTPTEEAQPEGEPGTAIEPGRDDPSDFRQREIDRMRREIAQLEEHRGSTGGAEERMAEANSAWEGANDRAREAAEAVDQAKRKLAELQNAGAGAGVLEDQEAAILRLEAEAGEAEAAAHDAEQRRNVVAEEAQRQLEQYGSDAESERAIADLRKRLEELEQEQEAATPADQRDRFEDREREMQNHRDVLANAMRSREQAMEDATTGQRGVAEARQRLETAEEALVTAQQAGDDAAVQAAEAVVRSAQEAQAEAVRASEAAEAALESAERDVREATDSLAKYEDAAPPEEPRVPGSPPGAPGVPRTDR